MRTTLEGFAITIIGATLSGVLAVVTEDATGFDPSWSLGALTGLVWMYHRVRAEMVAMRAEMAERDAHFMRTYSEYTVIADEVNRDAYARGVRDGANAQARR